MNTEVFNRSKIPQRPQESDIERTNQINLLATSTPLVNFKKHIDFDDFWNGISSNAPSKIFALNSIVDELNFAKKRLLTAQKFVCCFKL